MKVQWLWGSKCNYDCYYCPPSLHNNKMVVPDQETFIDCLRYLSSIIRFEDKTPIYEFTGGEPSQIPYFNKLLTEASGNYPPSYRLVTNGSGSMEWWEDVGPQFDDIEISYHTMYARRDHIIEVYNFLQNLDNNPKVTIKIHVTNDDKNWMRGIGVFEYFKSIGITSELKLLYSDFTKGTQLYPYKTYQLEYYYHSIGKVFELEKTVHRGVGIIPSRYRHDITKEKLEDKSYNFKDMKCNAGLEQLIVDDKGDVFVGWCKVNGSIGNVFKRNVSLPTDPLICTKDYCRNGFDRQAKKFI